MAGGTTPNKSLPFLPEIPINKDDWQRLRLFLTAAKGAIESMAQNPDPPDPVRGLTLTVKPSGVELNWNPANRATGYVVYRAVDSYKFTDAEAIGTLSRADNVSFFDPAGQTAAGTPLTYWVQSQNGLILGPISTHVATNAPLIDPVAIDNPFLPALPNVTRQHQMAVMGTPDAAAAPSSTNTGTDVVTIGSSKNWQTGTRVQVSASGGGLTVNTNYYLARLSSTTFSFYPTVEDAFNGTNKVDLTATISATITPDAYVFATIPAGAAQPAHGTFRNEGTGGNWLIRFGGVAPTTTVYAVKVGPGSSSLGVLGEAFSEDNPPTGDICVLHDNPSASGAGILACFADWNDGTTPLAGPTGPAGANGATWRSGSGAPSNGLGVNGDFYLDTATGNVYLKTSGTYSIVTNIIGPTGPTGPIGPVGPGYLATSSTSLTTSNSGSKSFTTQSGLAYSVGARIRATSTGTGEWMEGVVTSYSGTTLVATMDLNSGTGTHADWNINLSGQQGATGAAGTGGFLQVVQTKLTGGNVTTTSTTFVDLTGASVTLTTGAHRCMVTVILNIQTNTANAPVVVDIDIDGTRQGGTSNGLILTTPISGFFGIANFSFMTGSLSAGSHTIKLKWRTNSGVTATAFASDPPLFIQVAEMGI